MRKLLNALTKPTRLMEAEAIYDALDAECDLFGNKVDKDFFTKNFEHNYFWARMYFANPAIVSGRMQLRFFLEGNSAELFKTLLNNPRPPLEWLTVAQHEQ